MNRVAIMAATTLALGFGTVATAQTASAACGTAVDVDWESDGTLLDDEFKLGMGRAFLAWDSDRDGRLSIAEFKNCFGKGDVLRARRDSLGDDLPGNGYGVGARNGYLFSKWDSNDDGYLSRVEFVGDGIFADIDRNQDERLTPAEIWAAM